MGLPNPPGAGDQFRTIDAAQREQEVRLRIEPRADAIEDCRRVLGLWCKRQDLGRYVMSGRAAGGWLMSKLMGVEQQLFEGRHFDREVIIPVRALVSSPSS